MVTESFVKSYREAKKRNRLLSFDEKMEIWSHCKRDWDCGVVNDDGTPKIMPYIPFKEAELIHKSTARFLVILGGNRFSKSLIAAMEAVAMMTIPNTHIYIIGPEYKIIDVGEWKYIEHALTKTDVWHKAIKPKVMAEQREIGCNKKPKFYLRNLHGKQKSITINFPVSGPSIVEQISYKNISSASDGIKMEGAKLSMIIFAEGSRVPKTLWEKNLRRRLSDKYGRVIIPCTSKGKDEFLWPSYMKGLSSKLEVDIDFRGKTVRHYYKNVTKTQYHIDNAVDYADSYETFHYPAFVNPYFNMAEYEADKRALFATKKEDKLDPSIFRERNFGTFETLAGNFYRDVDFKVLFVKSKDYKIPDKCTHYRCIDPGRVEAAAVEWIAVTPPDPGTGRSKIIIYDEIYESDHWAKTLAERIFEKEKDRDYVIRFSACDRVVSQDTNASERTVEEQLIEHGIDPLYIPQSMPNRTIDRLNAWLYLLIKGDIVILKDKCPNLARELVELEYGEPKYVNGRTKSVEVLNRACDMHAIDAITYGFYCDCFRWRKPILPKPKVTEPELESFLGARNSRLKQQENTGIMSIIGSF